MTLNICIKFHENNPDGIKVIEWTHFQQKKNSKRHNSIKNVAGVMVLFLCTSSDSASYMYKVS